jgi:hypothetical protein
LPPELRGNAGDAEHSRGGLLALVIAGDPALRERQLLLIGERLGVGTKTQVMQFLRLTTTLAPLLRLPAVLQLLPSLRALPDTDRMALLALLRELMQMDGEVSVADYVLEKLVARTLAMQITPRAPHGSATLADVQGDLGVVFAVLARHGSGSAGEARRAYEAGIASVLPRHRPAYAVIETWPPLLDRSLDQLGTLDPLAKQMLVEGLVRTIAHDEMLTVAEAELLRAICAVLEVPLPPLLPSPLPT